MDGPNALEVQDELGPEVGISLPEAALRYGVSLRSLSQRVRLGEIPAYKIRGLRGREWRVLPEEMASAGYTLASAAPPDEIEEPDEVAALRHHVRLLERQLAAERRRVNQLDQRLGEVLLECGRLRAVRSAAGVIDLSEETSGAERPLNRRPS